MLQQLARWILYKRMGWKTIITVEHPSKYIICLAPHTSNWDFVIGQLFGLAERIFNVLCVINRVAFDIYLFKDAIRRMLTQRIVLYNGVVVVNDTVTILNLCICCARRKTNNPKQNPNKEYNDSKLFSCNCIHNLKYSYIPLSHRTTDKPYLSCQSHDVRKS